MTIYDEIAAERAARDQQWGGPEHDDRHAAEGWIAFIQDKLDKADALIGLGEDTDVADPDAEYRRRMIQIAALATAAIESLDRQKGVTPVKPPTGPAPELYRQLAEPRASKEDAGVSLDAFMAEVHAARVKHRIPELLALPVVYWKNPAGTVQSLGTTAFYGDQANALPVAATALRRFKQDHDRRIAEMAGLLDGEDPADAR